MKLKLLAVIFITSLSFGQTKEDVAKIIKNYDITKIKERVLFFDDLEKKEKQNALEKANQNGWPIYFYGKDGSFQELINVTSDGYPIYKSTHNVDAARSTRTIHLNSGGSLGLNLNGQGMVARVWDGGTVRRTHNLFEGRVTTVDDASGTAYEAHATHVTGTILASNSSATAKGMAYQATARTFNWTNDESEATSEVLLGMLISNHSYGIPVTSNSGVTLPSWFIGSYSSDARNWDEIAYLAPYYLPVMSAGNDGNNNNNSNPILFGFDKLTGDKTAKNTLVVANAEDATVTNDGTLVSVNINSSSSQGPTDDLRIKPDITGNGTALTSTESSSNSATGVRTGTSMASPNVAGTLLLLQQYHKSLTNSFMKASTLKGLACHTADDSGNIGPDPIFGWGLLNAKKAAQTLTNNGLNSWVSEENLSNGETFTMTFNSTGGSNNPLIASITWTDVPGEVNNTMNDNDTTPALVNNLDIKIIKDGTEVFYPWRLNPNVPTSNALRNADNNVDNVEQVMIDTPVAGNYVISVSHKGNLVNGNQNFSLIVTGVNSTFSLTPKTDDLTVCSNQNAVFTFDYKQIGNGTTSFSATGLPAGATASFNPTNLSSNGVVVMTISGLTNVIPNEYTIGIVGNNGIETEKRTKKLRIFSNSFQPVIMVSPVSNQNNTPTNYQLKWQSDPNVESYIVQMSTSPTFSTISLNDVTSSNQYDYWNLAQETLYYWRVIPSNRCGSMPVSSANVFSFRTGKLVCGYSFTANDFSNATISSTSTANATVPINVTGGLKIGDIDVTLNISHSYIQDIVCYLEGPASIGSPVIKLFNNPCENNDDINCTLDDFGNDLVCNSGSPSIFGTVIPFEYLSKFNGLDADGTWILRVTDLYVGDGGQINNVTLSICNIEQSLNTDSNELSDYVNVYPNPAKHNLNISLNKSLSGSTSYTLIDMQGRRILNKQSSDTNVNLNIENLVEGVYLLSIENGNDKTTKKVVVKR